MKTEKAIEELIEKHIRLAGNKYLGDVILTDKQLDDGYENIYTIEAAAADEYVQMVEEGEKVMKTEKAIKELIIKRIHTLDFNLKVFNIVRDHVAKHEGKKYTRRYLPKLEEEFYKVFGSGFFSLHHGVSLDTQYTWKSIALNFNVPTDIEQGYSYSYQLHYDRQELVTLEEFDNLNKCWSLDVTRREELSRLLESPEKIKNLAKQVDAINAANKALEEAFSFGNDECEIEYRVKDLLDVKLERK